MNISESFKNRLTLLAGIISEEKITKNFSAKVKHDGGTKTIKTSASDEAAAKSKICTAEGCPESAIVSIKEV